MNHEVRASGGKGVKGVRGARARTPVKEADFGSWCQNMDQTKYDQTKVILGYYEAVKLILYPNLTSTGF